MASRYSGRRVSTIAAEKKRRKTVHSKAAWGAAASVAGRELCLTLPFALPMTVLFRAVYRRAHRND